MEAAAALVPSLGLLSSFDALAGAAEARRRGAPVPAGETARPTGRPGTETGDDTVLFGELLSAGGGDRQGAAADGDGVLSGSPTLRNALAHGGGVDGQRAVQSYEEQRRAGYIQELRQATVVDLYV